MTALLSIAYDALNRRVASTEHIDPNTGVSRVSAAETYHVFDGLNVIEEYAVNSNGTPDEDPAREFIWGAAVPEPWS